jgi:hypothetical protein
MHRVILAAMIVLTVLYGCAEASKKPVERAEKQHGLDKSKLARKSRQSLRLNPLRPSLQRPITRTSPIRPINRPSPITTS